MNNEEIVLSSLNNSEDDDIYSKTFENVNYEIDDLSEENEENDNKLYNYENLNDSSRPIINMFFIIKGKDSDED
jgi:hypothetical protein